VSARRNFLRPERLARCLRAYAERPKARGWWVSEKARLYGLAAAAFDPERLDPAAFREIHRTLRAYWQIFRNGRGWSAARTFRVLTSPPCRVCARGRLALPDLARDGGLARVWPCLAAMSGVKTLPKGNVSAMAVSKFLHFFNPSLFPIYDQAVVRNRAFPRFRAQINASRQRRGDRLAPIEAAPLFVRGLGPYVHYLLWAADCYADVDVDFVMTEFEAQFAAMLRDEGREATPPAGLDRHFATAFEFALVGALSAP
jgi:hypothetical protein